MAGLLAYWNSLRCPLVFDDVPAIAANRTIRMPLSLSVLVPPGEGNPVQGRPVANLSFALNYALGGLDVRGYHLFNLAVHILAALLLFAVVRRTLSLPRLRGRFGAATDGIALASALLWELHPLQTEAVTYLSQRTESMMGLFFLLALYLSIRGAQSRRPGRWYAGAAIASVLGAASKEVAAVLPLTILLYDRVFLWRSWPEVFRRRRTLYAALALGWVALAVDMSLGAGSRGGTATLVSSQITPLEYALTQCRYILRYLGLSLWPHPLIFDYGLPDGGVPIVRSIAASLPWVLPVLALLAVASYGLYRLSPWGFLAAWVFLILAPTSSFLPIVTEVVAEHRMYLPLAGIVVLITTGTSLLLHRIFGRRSGRAGLILVLGGAVVLGTLTHRRNAAYASELSLWQETLARRPGNARALGNIGSCQLDSGEYEAALASFNRAIKIKNNHPDFYSNRGNAYRGLADYGAALQDYDKAIALNPNSMDALNNRGLLHANLGQYELAIQDFRRVLDHRAGEPDAHNNLGLALLMTGRYEGAIREMTRAIELKPDYAEAYCNRGIAWVRMNDVERARRDYDTAIALKPDYANAFSNRGALRLAAGDADEAVRDYTRAIELRPDLAELYSHRADAWRQKRDYDRAWTDVATCRALGGAPDPRLIESLERESGRSD